MFKKQSKQSNMPKGATTLIASGTKVEGTLCFSGSLIIEGIVEGKITADKSDAKAQVRIMEKGNVKGDIHSPLITINGKVAGNVVCDEHIELAENAIIEGDVHYRSIEMAKGAGVNGSLINDVEKAVAKPKASSATALV